MDNFLFDSGQVPLFGSLHKDTKKLYTFIILRIEKVGTVTMPDVYFSGSADSRIIPVPESFLVQDMPEANGNYVKVYLYLFRCCYMQCGGVSTSSCADALHMMESDVIQALYYWQKQGLMSVSRHNDQLSVSFTSRSLPPSDPTRADKESPDEPSQEAAKVIRVERKPTYTPEEINIYKENPTIRKLFSEVQQITGDTLGSSAMMTLFSFYDYYRLPVDVILYMISYCVENGHRSWHYFEKTAIDWSDHDIQTVQQARSYTNFFSIYTPLYKALGTAYHRPTRFETECVDRWTNDYHMSAELILEAARRTLDSTGKPSFKYMDSILKKWYASQVTDMAGVQRQDEEYERQKAARNTPSNPSYQTRKGAFFAGNGQNYYDYETYQRLSYEEDQEPEEEPDYPYAQDNGSQTDLSGQPTRHSN